MSGGHLLAFLQPEVSCGQRGPGSERWGLLASHRPLEFLEASCWTQEGKDMLSTLQVGEVTSHIGGGHRAGGTPESTHL